MKIIYMFILVLVIGCKTVSPSLTFPDRTTTQRLPVKGRQGLLVNQKLNFGEFNTSQIKRSWTRAGNSRVDIAAEYDPYYMAMISMEYMDRGQTFYFQLDDATSNISDVYASSQFSAKNLRIGDNPNSLINIAQDIFGATDYSENLFYLQIYLNEETGPWELLLDNEASQSSSKNYTGLFLKDKDNYYTLEPISKVQGNNGPKEIFGTIGFEILNRLNEPVAAVSLIDNGVVYFNTTDPEEKFLMANLCAALLLQENLEQE